MNRGAPRAAPQLALFVLFQDLVYFAVVFGIGCSCRHGSYKERCGFTAAAEMASVTETMPIAPNNAGNLPPKKLSTSQEVV